MEGVIVTDKDGAAIHTTMDNTNTVMYAEGVRSLAMMGNSMVRDIDPTNELLYIRIGTKKLEMMAHSGMNVYNKIIMTKAMGIFIYNSNIFLL